MPAAELYRRQAALLVRTLPLVAVGTCFAQGHRRGDASHRKQY